MSHSMPSHLIPSPAPRQRSTSQHRGAEHTRTRNTEESTCGSACSQTRTSVSLPPFLVCSSPRHADMTTLGKDASFSGWVGPSSPFWSLYFRLCCTRYERVFWTTLLIRIWMLSKSVASMTIGKSMGQEICLIGQVSITDTCGPGGD